MGHSKSGRSQNLSNFGQFTYVWQAMAMGGLSQAALKQKIESVSKQIFEIDLKIQSFRQQEDKVESVHNLEAAKLQLQQDIVSLQINLELAKAKNKKH